MNPTLYLVALRWVKTPMKTTELEPVFNALGNWARFNGWTWFLHTTKSSAEIYAVISKQITTDDSVLVVAINARDRQGWIPTWLVKWFAEKLP